LEESAKVFFCFGARIVIFSKCARNIISKSMGTVESKPVSYGYALFDRCVRDEGIIPFKETDVYAVDLTFAIGTKEICFGARHFSLYFINRGNLVRKDDGRDSNAFLLSHAQHPKPEVAFKDALKGSNSFQFTARGVKGHAVLTDEHYSHVGVVLLEASSATRFDVLVSQFAHQDRKPHAFPSTYRTTCFVFVVADLCGTKVVAAAYPARAQVTGVEVVRIDS
jgi:hypothetical protein